MNLLTESVNDTTTQPPEHLNMEQNANADTAARRRRYRSPEAARASKERYRQRWHIGIARREHVVNHRGYRPSQRAVDPDSGLEPAYNAPAFDGWTDEDEEANDAELLTAMEAAVMPPRRMLMGLR